MEASRINTLNNNPTEEIIDLRQYWRTLMSHKWGITSFSFITTLLTILIVFNMTPIYQSSSTLLIESQQANVVSIQEVYGLDGSSEYLLTQFEILKSRNLAKKVIKKLDLVNHPAYNTKETELPESLTAIKDYHPKTLLKEYFPDIFPAPEEAAPADIAAAKLDEIISSFQTSLSISPIRKTQLVIISFQSSDAELAAIIANEVANSYIENNLAAKLELTVKATTWLNSQLKDQRSSLTAAEKRLQEYREQEQIVGKDGGLGIAEREIDLVSEKLVDAKRERLELKSQYDQIQKLGRKSSRNLQQLPAILSHQLVQNLKDAVAQVELRKSEIANRYGKKHPKMKAANSELSRAYSNLSRQIISIARGIENKYQIAQDNVASLEQSLADTRSQMQSLSGKEYKLNELQQDVNTKRELFEQFFTRFSETSATGDLKTANARITDQAEKSRFPIKPNKKLIVALALVASFMFGVMVAFLLKALDNTIKTSQEVEQKLNEQMLGLLPLLTKKKREPHPSYKHFLEEPQSSYSESLRTIRTGIILSSLDNPYKTICITSTTPAEGKTSTALGLAYSLAQVGSVLLIDADMRRPSIHKALQMTDRKIGLSNLVAGTNTMEECIATDEEGGFDVLVCGTIPPNPSELLSSQKFKDLLTGLAKIYDKIIIDTAPCQSVSDALVLSPMVDAYLYVVKSDSTTEQHAKNGLKRIRQANGNIAGIILNQVNLKKTSLYYGEEYSGYYDTYGYAGNNS